MMDIQNYKVMFAQYGGMMRTKGLHSEKVYYNNIQQLKTRGIKGKQYDRHN